MGGVGKTELARFLASEAEAKNKGSVIWVTIGERRLADVHNELARALGVFLPPNLDPQGKYKLLRTAFESMPRLVVLDDIRADFAPYLPLCLPPSPPCAVLITSRLRELPGLPAGVVRPLDVMTQAQALELLRNIPGLTEAIDRESAEALTLCRLCGFHPLALDLAGRRLFKRLRDSSTPIATFNRSLAGRLTQLQVGTGPLENLATNFELSYAGLMQDDRVRFRRLGVFAITGFSISAAARVWGDDDSQARDALDRLMDFSMVMPAETLGRFRLHDLLRDFASAKLLESSEADAVNRTHAEYLVSLFEELYIPEPSIANEATSELDNLRVAAEWALTKGDGQILALLATRPRNWLYTVFQIWDEWLKWLDGSLRLGFEDTNLKGAVIRMLGDVQQFRDERNAALQSYQQALALFRQVGDRLGEANVLQAIGDVQQFRDDRDAALQSYQQALALFRQVGDRLGEANTLKAIGDVQQFRKETDAALQSYQQALALFRQVGDRLGEANTLKAIGDVQQFRKETDAALQSYQQALALFRQVGARLGEANVLQAIGDVQQFRKETDAALQSYQQALALFRQVGDRLGEANTLKAIGDVQQFRDDRDAALQSYQQALALFRQVGDRLGEANTLKAIGDVQQFRKETDAALQSYQQALALFRQVGARLGEANVLQAIGDVQQFRDERDAALQSYQQALALFRQIGARLGEANVLKAIGDVQQFRKDMDAALQSYQQALTLFRQVGDRLGEANVLHAIGDVQQSHNEQDAALVSYQQALALFRAVGVRLGEANVQLSLGDIRRADRNFAGAKSDYDTALKIYQTIGDRYSEARALYRIGDSAASEKQWTEALRTYQQAANIWREMGLSDLVERILAPRIAQVEENMKSTEDR
jgi:tetratricopeptide (TPR) repeat protein